MVPGHRQYAGKWCWKQNHQRTEKLKPVDAMGLLSGEMISASLIYTLLFSLACFPCNRGWG